MFVFHSKTVWPLVSNNVRAKATAKWYILYIPVKRTPFASQETVPKQCQRLFELIWVTRCSQFKYIFVEGHLPFALSQSNKLSFLYSLPLKEWAPRRLKKKKKKIKNNIVRTKPFENIIIFLRKVYRLSLIIQANWANICLRRCCHARPPIRVDHILFFFKRHNSTFRHQELSALHNYVKFCVSKK